MAYSQNGWSIVNGNQTDRTSFAGKMAVGGVRKGDVSVIFNYLMSEFNSKVETIVQYGTWGWAPPKLIPGGKTYSNHASATAVDINAPKHPWTKRGTFSASQVRGIRKILADCGGVVRWGGDYSSRPDEMHFEINANVAAVKTAASKLKKGDGMSQTLTNKNHLTVLFRQFVNRVPTAAEYKDYVGKPYDYALNKLHPARRDLQLIIDLADSRLKHIKALEKAINDDKLEDAKVQANLLKLQAKADKLEAEIEEEKKTKVEHEKVRNGFIDALLDVFNRFKK